MDDNVTKYVYGRTPFIVMAIRPTSMDIFR